MNNNNTLTETDSKDGHAAASEVHSAAVHATDMRELSSFLELMIDQISLLLQESGESVGELIGSIMMMADNIDKIEQQVPELIKASKNSHQNAVDAEITDVADILSVSETIKALCSESESNMEKVVTACQFYDRLSQRILHIQENLQAVSEVTRAQDKQHPALWQRLHDRMRSVYTLEQEQRLYWALLKRLSAEGLNSEAMSSEAMSSETMENEDAAASPGSNKASPYGDIELF